MPYYHKLITGLLIFFCVSAAWSADSTVNLSARENYPQRVYTGVPPLPLQLNITTSETCPTEDLHLQAVLTDASGQVIDTQDGSIGLKPDMQTWLAFALQPSDFGYYGFDVIATDPTGAEVTRYSTSYAVLRPLNEPFTDARASVIGVNTHFEHNQGDLSVLELLYQAGIRWIREPVYWPGVERTDGVYEVSASMRSVFKLAKERYGINTLVVLAYDHHIHGRNPEKYGVYCREVARQLRGLVEHFEIWNEPNGFGNVSPEEYCNLLEAGYKGVKEGNPDAFVVGVGGASPGGWGGWYLPTIIEKDKHRFMDTFSVHPYCSPAPAEIGYATDGGPSPVTALDHLDALTGGAVLEIQKVRDLSQRPGVWITEMGWPSNHTDLNAQAMAVSRAYLTTAALSELYERIFIYNFMCDGISPDNIEHNFGMLNADYSVRPAYVATATIARALAGRKFLRRLPHLDPSVFLYLFGPEESPMLAAWCSEVSAEEAIARKTLDGQDANALNRVGSRPDKSFNIRIKASGETAQLHDWQDCITELPVVDNSITIKISWSPVFVNFSSPDSNISVLP